MIIIYYSLILVFYGYFRHTNGDIEQGRIRISKLGISDEQTNKTLDYFCLF